MRIGQTVLIKKSIPDRTEGSCWYGWQKARVVYVSPYFITFEILPHKNPAGFSLSEPYRESIHRHYLTTGRYIVKE